MKGRDGSEFLGAIDRAIHEPARLIICALLSGVDEADFLFLQRETGLTKGNLSSHITTLEKVGYVDVGKTYDGKRPLTILSLNDEGRRAFADYRTIMGEFINTLGDKI